MATPNRRNRPDRKPAGRGPDSGAEGRHLGVDKSGPRDRFAEGQKGGAIFKFIGDRTHPDQDQYQNAQLQNSAGKFGEQRLSNFMLWQCAYSEFLYNNINWPDFSIEDLHKAIESYHGRDRRYGGTK